MTMSVVFVLMNAIQMDQELSMHTFFLGKHSLNRAVHAAAQQVDLQKLATGIYSIDESKAQNVASEYLQENLRLDSQFNPVPDSFFRSEVKVVLFKVINEKETFPYTYYNATYKYSVVLQNPGVVMMIQLDYPRMYQVLPPITWTIKGIAEIVS